MRRHGENQTIIEKLVAYIVKKQKQKQKKKHNLTKIREQAHN